MFDQFIKQFSQGQLGSGLYLVAGEERTKREILENAPKGWEIDQSTIPQLSIADARYIRSKLSSKSHKKRRAIIIASLLATAESQQALLKSFEEIPENTTVVWVFPTPERLLETIRSRAVIISTSGEPDGEYTDFLSMGVVERLDYVDSRIKDSKTDDAKHLLRQELVGITKMCEHDLYSRKDWAALAHLKRVRSWLPKREIPVRLIAEYLATSLPSVARK